MTTVNAAANAYLNTAKQLATGAGQPQDAGAASGATGSPSFVDLLQQGVQGAMNAQHTSEKVSANALLGKANMTDVLQAVNNAELALNEVLAIRDKLVQAYDDIQRTQI